MPSKNIILNLLPGDKKRALRKHLILRLISFCLAVSFIIISTVAAALSLSKLILLDTFNDSIVQSTLIPRELGGANNLIKQVNFKLDTIDKIERHFSPWSEHLINISKMIPKDITLTSLSAEKFSRSLMMRGTAKTRNDLLSLLAALENSGLFESIESPISNILVKEDIAFDLKMKIKESILAEFSESR